MEKSYREIIAEKVNAAIDQDELRQIESEVFEHFDAELNQKKELARQAIEDYKKAAWECYDVVSIATRAITGHPYWFNFNELHRLVNPAFKDRK